MENAIIVGILLIVLVLALLRVRKHFRGGCCGGGSATIRSKKTLSEPKIGQMILHVEGMHCENCQARVENVLNNLPGAACRVDLKKKIAVVEYSRPVSVEEVRDRVEKLGYRVTDVE